MDRSYLANFDQSSKDNETYDVVIIGSGIAGLYTALMMNRSNRILIVSKAGLKVSNSYLAQGGIAASLDEDEAIRHIEDTIYAGCNHNDLQAVKQMVLESKENIDELMRLRVPFDRDDEGELHMTREGGHSTSRILHIKDRTGESVVDTLIHHVRRRANITVLENTFALDVLTSDKKAVGVMIMDLDGGIQVINTPHVVLATGGIGKLYTKSTNSAISTGDGIGMAARAHAEFRDMEFIQFHPTALDVEDEETFLISEAVRGEGGRLVNSQGVYFMAELHPMKDLAPRNIVSEAIFSQMRLGHQVYLDVTHLDPAFVRERFPHIHQSMLEKGLDITQELIPVSPAQHYFMGGILVDANGCTSIEGLYACGEVASTGVHGANRLASNSLLEGLVFGRRIADDISKVEHQSGYKASNASVAYTVPLKKITEARAAEIKATVKEIMTSSAFIVRSMESLENAHEEIETLQQEVACVCCDSFEKAEAVNMVTASAHIIKAAMERGVSLGSHIVVEK